LIASKKGLFVSFEDVEVLSLFNQDIKKFAKRYLKDTELLCIDEFQYAKNGGKNLKYLFDTYTNKKIIISGSSAVDLTIHAIKFLVGRISGHLIEMSYSWSFQNIPMQKFLTITPRLVGILEWLFPKMTRKEK
jgi:predicted AAA+ superfamily ATPase